MVTFDVKGLLFDLDGMLVDSTAVMENVWKNFCAKNSLDAQPVIAYAHGRQTLDTPTHFIGEGEATNKAAASLEEIEINTLEGVVEIQGAANLLTQLPVDRRALVTSAGRQLAENRMKAAGLPLPAVMICAEDVNTGKPSPEGYLQAATALGFTAGECLVFDAGIKAGLASGASVVAARPGAAGATEAHAVTELNRVTTASSGDVFTVTCD